MKQMTAIARFYGSSIGKKIIVAVTGALIILFLIVHMLGNLQVFEGRGPSVEQTRLNEYAELLRLEPALLWAFRLGLLGLIVLHVLTTLTLYFQNRAARGTSYAVKKNQASTLSSRTMVWGGVLIGAFVVYHILHLTVGTAHHDQVTQFGHHDVYSRVVYSFQHPIIALMYIAAMIVIFFHLKHAITSSAQTLGVNNPRYLSLFEKGGPVVAALLVIGFLAVPVSIWLGLVE